MLYRIEERFEREVAPFGAVDPMATVFWRACVISHFTAKKGYKGWALANDSRQKIEPKASTFYFAIGNTPDDLPHNLRSDFSEISGFQEHCSKFMKPQYHWW